MNRCTAFLSHASLLAALAVTLHACNPYGDYCQEAMDCEGGNEADIDACVVDIEEAEEHASLWDCDEWFDAAFECAEVESECENDRYGVPTDSDGHSRCEDEQEDYQACAGY